jgi:hypothetical protein
VWQDKPATALRVRWRDRLRDWFQGNADKRNSLRRYLLDINPVTWLASRDRWKPVYPNIFLGVVLVGWIIGFNLVGRDWLSIEVAVAVAILLHLVLRIWMGAEAGLCFAENMRSGALELVLSSSITIEDILRGQLRALRRQFFWPTAIVLLADLLLLLLGIHHEGSQNTKAWMSEAFVICLCMIMFVSDMYVLAWSGMWQGLVAKDPKKASGAATVRILFLPWLYLMGFMVAIGMSGAPQILGASVVIWFVIGLINNGVFLSTSQDFLRTQFRSVVMQRYSAEPTKPSLWDSLPPRVDSKQ